MINEKPKMSKKWRDDPRRCPNVYDAIGDLPEPHAPLSRKETNIIAATAKEELLLRQWDEARIIELPRHYRDAAEPRVLVERSMPPFTDAAGNQVVYFEDCPAISLFTGAGGFDIGMEGAGFIPVVQHEMDEHCCMTLLENRPDYFRHSALIQGNIYKTPTEMLLCAAGLRVGEAHILTGGPPCQGFSTSGKRDPNDPRNDLVFEFLRVVREAQPKFFIMENVPGILSAAKGQYFRDFLKAAYDCFYELVYGLVCASEYGVPQYRTRFICAGTRRDMFAIDGTLASLPEPQCFSEGDCELIDLLEGLEHYAPDLEILRHPPGIRYFPDRPILVPPAPLDRQHGIAERGRSKSFLKFFCDLRDNEPDRIVSKDTKWEVREPSLIITP